ncbi:MAG: YdiU family protein [Burkholderiaceae bacterium]|nr:YdiU family protein [Burkholderiaceae bacterium]
MNCVFNGESNSELLTQSRFSQLGDAFHAKLQVQPLPEPYWVCRNAALARELGLDDAWMNSQEALNLLTGNQVLPATGALASVYSGHQFGQWAGQLGDGRAMLLGALKNAQASEIEIQLKGAGRTPYSRGGDGRAVLRSSIREFLCSEAMHSLGIATTRALCVTGSDAPIYREVVESAAVVTRTAASFVRFGHFEHFSYNNLHAELKQLADFVIDHHYPECRQSDAFAGNPYAALLAAVSQRTAHLVAQWQAVGFCHGVMNTDNMSILGLTLDYGPFQFLDAFNPDHICNHTDSQGRYAYNKQPNVAYWNLFCLGQALLPLISEQELALAALEPYKTAFPAEFEAQMRTKLGLPDPQPEDSDLIRSLQKLLAQDKVDYTIFWRTLSHFVAGSSPETVRDLFIDRPSFDAWLLQYSERIKHINRRLSADLMLKTNPKFVLRNYLGEQAIAKAKLKDFSEVETLLSLLQTPFDEHPDHEAYASFPPDWASEIEISCSS